MSAANVNAQSKKKASKSDKDAKVAFCEELEKKGYKDVEVIRLPADIIAFRGGKKNYFEHECLIIVRLYSCVPNHCTSTSANEMVPKLKFHLPTLFTLLPES